MPMKNSAKATYAISDGGHHNDMPMGGSIERRAKKSSPLEAARTPSMGFDCCTLSLAAVAMSHFAKLSPFAAPGKISNDDGPNEDADACQASNGSLASAHHAVVLLTRRHTESTCRTTCAKQSLKPSSEQSLRGEAVRLSGWHMDSIPSSTSALGKEARLAANVCHGCTFKSVTEM